MRILFCTMVLLTGLTAQQCKQDINPEFLYQQWTHLHEEDAGGVEVYRNKDYDFPPSRGRQGFEFRKDGTFIQSDIGPVDVNVKTSGKWERTGEREVKITLEDQQRPPYRMEIVELTKDRLKIRQVAAK
jgi:hypothetical protein